LPEDAAFSIVEQLSPFLVPWLSKYPNLAPFNDLLRHGNGSGKQRPRFDVRSLIKLGEG